MTALAITYISNPFKDFLDKFMIYCEIVGYARAASYLQMHGFHEEAKRCMMEVKKLKS